MGKSPGKWIKTVLFGKKSSKSNLSKDATLIKKTSINSKAQSKDFDNDSMVISSPVLPVMHASVQRTELEKTPSANLTSDTTEIERSNTGHDTANEDESIRLEQAVIKAQAVFRGHLARRAFGALKCIIRLQAQVRGHLVRRQAVATLSCMRAIVEFQAVARGRKVRLSADGPHVLQKYTMDKKRADLLGTSLRSEKLSTNAFATKLVASLQTTMPLTLHYDPTEPNSLTNWLSRWSTSHFWEPLPPPKKTPNLKPKRKQTKPQPEETETTKPKRSVRRITPPNLDNNLSNSTETEKPKANLKKTSTQQTESVQEQSHSELEKVKRSLRKISVSTEKASEKVNDLIEPEPEPTPAPAPEHVRERESEPVVEDDHRCVELPPVELDEKVEVESEGPTKEFKENQKTRRRKSFPAKQENTHESVLQSTPTLPSYMAATESAKAKLRAQAAAKAAEDGVENGFVRRHSLPSSTGKMSLHSPRVQKPLQANGKGWNKSNKPQISARDDKTGWKR